MIVLYKPGRKCHLIDIALPGNKKIELKEHENLDNHGELRQ